MKKLIAILLFAFTFIAAVPKVQAQSSLTSQYFLTTDTVTSAVKYLTYQVTAGVPNVIEGYKKLLTVQLTVDENSAVTTAGVAQLQGSLNGVKWYDLDSTTFQKSRVNLADASSKTYSLTAYDWGSRYLRLAVTPTGTLADKIYAIFLIRTP